MCAIRNGQEELSTRCFRCVNTSGLDEVTNQLAKEPVLASPNLSRASSPIGSQKGAVAGSEDEEERDEEPSMLSASPNKYAVGGYLPPQAGTPRSQRVYGYGAGYVLPQIGDGQCCFSSTRASAGGLDTYLTEEQKKFFARTTTGLKHRMKESLLDASDLLLDYKWDMRVGCPPDSPDEDDISKMASIRQVLLDDHGETPEEHAISIMAKSYYGGVVEMMLVAAATGLVVQSGTSAKVGGSTVFQPLLQFTPSTVDLACYPEVMLLKLVFNGTNHFDGFVAVCSHRPTPRSDVKVVLSNRFALLADEDGDADGNEGGDADGLGGNEDGYEDEPLTRDYKGEQEREEQEEALALAAALDKSEETVAADASAEEIAVDTAAAEEITEAAAICQGLRGGASSGAS